MPLIPLAAFCQARSGDKADVANIAVFAPTDGLYAWLRRELTAERVRQHLAALVAGDVVRYEVPKVRALNFVCRNALGGGGTNTLRSDLLGKTLGANLLRITLDVPSDLLEDAPSLRPRSP
jgi:hypothetical protein